MTKGRSAWLLLFKGNKVLVLKRSNQVNNPGLWCLPGGSHKSKKYSLLIKKEIREEIGLDIKPHFILTHKYKGKVYKYYVCMYKPEKHGEIKLNCESVEYKWVKLENLYKLESKHNSLKVLKDGKRK